MASAAFKKVLYALIHKMVVGVIVGKSVRDHLGLQFEGINRDVLKDTRRSSKGKIYWRWSLQRKTLMRCCGEEAQLTIFASYFPI